MRVWRLAAPRHAASAMSGEGAARFGGRWNPAGTRMVYTADSLALATLELAVHLAGARMTYTAIEVDIPDRSVDQFDLMMLKRRWVDDESATQAFGQSWTVKATRLALAVPSALVDMRSGERNVLINPAHPALAKMRELQRFEVVLDQRL
jgi:RES domain-containing protein